MIRLPVPVEPHLLCAKARDLATWHLSPPLTQPHRTAAAGALLLTPTSSRQLTSNIYQDIIGFCCCQLQPRTYTQAYLVMKVGPSTKFVHREAMNEECCSAHAQQAAVHRYPAVEPFWLHSVVTVKRGRWSVIGQLKLIALRLSVRLGTVVYVLQEIFVFVARDSVFPVRLPQ